MATEIAAAYISLFARMPGVKKDLERQLGAAVPEPSQKAGSTLGVGLLEGAGNVLKGGALALGGLAAAGLGTALVKGFQRLDALDQAEAKLSGLGHSAQGVDEIMNNALAAVKGTAFGMGDAATVAAQVVAAGVKPGEELERTLSLVGDAATIAGTDISTMGSIVSKVSTSDMMQMDVANQLMDAGIPILQLLADEMGITADEAREMASAGEISFADFQNALESGMGGAALESGNTFQGAMDNVLAALGRIGEALLGGVFENLKGEFGDVTEWLDTLGPQFADFGATIGTFAADAVPIAVDAIKGFVGSLVAIVTFAQDNSDWLVPLAIGVGVFAAAIGAYSIGMAVATGAFTTWIAATKIGMAVQAAFNAVMAMNPIALVVLAIAALVAGLVWFFTQTELGQEIWANFTQFLGDAWNWLWESVISPVITWIGDAFTWLWENIIKPVADFIGLAFWALGEAARIMWEGFFKPVFEAIGAIFTWIFDFIVMPIVMGIVLYFKIWELAIMWLWENVIQPIFTAIGDIFTWIYNYIIVPIIDGIVLYFQMWGAIFTWLYENIVKPVFEGMGAVFTWLYENVILPVWNGIQAAIQAVADWFQNTLMPIFDTALGALGAAFEFLKSTVQTVWENIQEAAKAPIRFIVETVYNDGIARIFNDIAAAVGLGEDIRLKQAALPAGFASGGVLPGWSPGVDIHQFWSPTGGRLALSGGEAIMRPEFTAAVGGAAGVARLNSLARAGALGEQGFADGGIWEAVGGTFAGVGDWLSNVAGTVAAIVSDPLGSIERLILDPVKTALNDIGGGFLGTAMTEIPFKWVEGIKSWFSGLLAPTTQGANGDWQGGNTLARLMPIIEKYGLMITDTYRTKAQNDALGSGEYSYHRDYDNPAVDVAGPFSTMDAFAAEVAAMGGWRQLLWKVAGHWDHVHVASEGGVFGDLPTRKYDAGGYIEPGLSLVENGTGKPEPVFTSDQWSLIERAAGGGVPKELVVVDADGALIGRMRVEAADVTVRAGREAGVW